MKFFAPLLLLGASSLAHPTVESESIHEDISTAIGTSRYVVLFKDEVTNVVEHITGLHLPNPAMALYEGAIKGFMADLDPVTLALIRADPLVDVVQANQRFSASVQERFAGYGLAISSQSVRLSSGNQNDYFYDQTGNGVIVYVLDSGVRADHPDFQGRASNAANFITRQYGFADEPNTDTNGHGTAVSGCVGGVDWGISKNVIMKSAKVLSFTGDGHTGTSVAGINFAINDCNGRKCIINLSLGGPEDTAVDRAVSQANRAGLTVVAAAGNHNVDACHVSPAGSPDAITVGAIGPNYRRADFSNYGQCVDIFAPGVEIHTDSNKYPNPVSRFINGTSFSAPYVAGIAAYYLSAGLRNTPADVRAALAQFGMANLVSDPRGSRNLLANNGYFFNV